MAECVKVPVVVTKDTDPITGPGIVVIPTGPVLELVVGGDERITVVSTVIVMVPACVVTVTNTV